MRANVFGINMGPGLVRKLDSGGNSRSTDQGYVYVLTYILSELRA